MQRFIYSENFMRNSFTNPFQKSNSDKVTYECYSLYKGYKSTNKMNSLSDNNIQIKIILLNQTKNAKNIIVDIQEYIKQKKSKISNQDIKIIILGFDDYKGLLKYGLNNHNQINRIMTLQLLSSIFSAEKNIFYQKYIKILLRIAINQLLVENISFFQNSEFKLNYFKILKYYCQVNQKQNSKIENYKIKDLFLFHQELFHDFINYQKISQFNFNIQYHNQHVNFNKNKNMEEKEDDQERFFQKQNDFCQKIEINDFKDEDEDNFIMDKSHNNTLFIFQSMKTILLCFQTKKAINSLRDIMLKWNRYEGNVTFDQYSQKIRSIMTINNRKIYLKINIYQGSQIIQSQQKPSPIKECISNVQALDQQFSQGLTCKIVKTYQQIQGQTDYRQEIYFKYIGETAKILIGVYCSQYKQIINHDIFSMGHYFRQDLQKLAL